MECDEEMKGPESPNTEFQHSESVFITDQPPTQNLQKLLSITLLNSQNLSGGQTYFMVGKVFRNKAQYFSIDLMQKTNLLCPFVIQTFKVPYEFTKHLPQQIMCVEYSIKQNSTGYLVFVVLFNDYALHKVTICLDPKLNSKYSVCSDQIFKE